MSVCICVSAYLVINVLDIMCLDDRGERRIERFLVVEEIVCWSQMCVDIKDKVYTCVCVYVCM